jgi:hypothetical protein
MVRREFTSKEIPMRVLSVFALLAVAGFAPADDKKTEPKGEEVTGKVAFNGKALPVGTVGFVSKDGKTKIETLIAEDSSYKAVVPAGEYVVTISTVVAKKKDDKKEPPKVPVLKIPAKYGDAKTSPLTVTVKEGKNNLDINLIN